jgi:hypothetical protein
VAYATAPGAKIISLKASTGTQNNSVMSAVAAQAGIDWVLDNSEKYKFAAINMSFATTAFYSGDCDSTFDHIVDEILEFDIVPVAAAGNEGVKTSLPEPACSSSALAVGFQYDWDSQTTTTYYDPDTTTRTSFGTIICQDSSHFAGSIVCASNSSPSLDVVAPGCYLFAPGSWSWHTGGGGYGCGSSIAAPLVSGTVAAILGDGGAEGLDASLVIDAIRDPTGAFTVRDVANNRVSTILSMPIAMDHAKAKLVQQTAAVATITLPIILMSVVLM